MVVLINSKTKKVKRFLESKTPFSPGFLSIQYLGHGNPMGHDETKELPQKGADFSARVPGQRRTVLWVLFHQPSLRRSNGRAQLAAYPTGRGPWWLPLPKPRGV